MDVIAGVHLGRANAMLEQFTNKLVAVGDMNRVEPVSGYTVWILARYRDAVRRAEGSIVKSCIVAMPHQDPVKLLQILTPDRSRNVVHMKFVPGLRDIDLAARIERLVAIDAVPSQKTTACVVFCIPADETSAVDARYLLDCLEREYHEIGVLTDGLPIVHCPQRVRCIFNHLDGVGSPNLADSIDVAGITGPMHHHNGPRLVRNQRADLVRVDIASQRIDVRPYDAGAVLDDGRVGGNAGHWRCDYFCLGSPVDGHVTSEVQRG